MDLNPRAPRRRGRRVEPWAALEAELRRRTGAEVSFEPGTRALYATDASNYRQVPIAVVLPRTLEDVVTTVEVCRRHRAPLLSRGGGTSLAGQSCNHAVVLDWSRHLGGVLEIDPQRRQARVLPGTVLDTLRLQAELRHKLTFGPDPSTHPWCTLGGMIGNNSCGVHSQVAGRTQDNVESLEILTYRGLRLRVGRTGEAELAAIQAAGGERAKLYRGLLALRDRYADEIRARYPKIPRRVSGYNLDELLPEQGFNLARALVGSEGTCVTVLEATVRLVDHPPGRALLLVGYPDIFEAADHVVELTAFKPIGLEALDQHLLRNLRKKRLHTRHLSLLPEGGAFLLVEFGAATRAEARAAAERARARLVGPLQEAALRVLDDPGEMQHVWELRESGLGATARVPGEPDTWEGWEDSAVAPERLGAYLRELKRLYAEFGYDGALYGHFGQGCVHTRINFDLSSPPGIARYRAFLDAAADLCVAHGGSLSGEHGDGQSRAELLPRMFGPRLVQAFREFKALWDPDHQMNPGKVVDPFPITANLRLGPAGPPPPPRRTHFRFPEDGGDFTRATLRCVGVGKCRREQGGVMCPSYRATGEEQHSTRGRAHLLFEMLKGDVVSEGWRDPAVKEALDLCLACKGCKGECPVNVDMATYKAEFNAHYYRGRLRPRPAYAMGLVMFWARLAAWAPQAANFVSHRPPLDAVAKWLGGLAPQRTLPRFADQTFQAWARRRPKTHGARRVLLWPDTFNNHFHPETARAAVEVLERTGFSVDVPQGFFCCGRPLYDFGMLDTAKWLLRRTLRQLREEILAGTPIIVLEPSCAAVFRDELLGLFPEEPLARRLAHQVSTLGELLHAQGEALALPRTGGRALFQGHCHQRSLSGVDADLAVLRATGLEVQDPDAGCCGMAGSFGFERGDKYEVSRRCGEQSLLPRVRALPPDAWVVADGFSCREQVKQETGRTGLHLAEVLQQAWARSDRAPIRTLEQGPRRRRRGLPAFAALIAGGVTLTLFAFQRSRAHRGRSTGTAGAALPGPATRHSVRGASRRRALASDRVER